MLDRICNSLLALGDPEKNQLFADFSQWEATLKNPDAPTKLKEKREQAPASKGKLSYTEKKEYEQIEGKILKMEEERSTLNQKLEDPAVAHNPQELELYCTQIGLIENQIEQLYIRWDELERKLKDTL
jgi:ATP-binding cassette subfamily F protein uup